MNRNEAVKLAQQAIKANNKRLIDAVLAIKPQREAEWQHRTLDQLPLIAVTCSTGYECYAVVEELVATGKFRVRALFRTPGTHAAKRLERLLAKTEEKTPGLMTLHPGTDMNSAEILKKAFADCDGVVLYYTANTSKAGKVTNHGDDPAGGRNAVMRQVMASVEAIKATPSIKHAVTLIFPSDKVTHIVDDAPPCPWWIAQKLRLSDFLREQGINTTCIYRPAYYYAMHRVEHTQIEAHIRGETQMSRTMISENNLSGINEPDYMVNWVDVRDVGKWVGTCFEYPDVFSNEDLSIASSAHTGHELVEIAIRNNRHGTQFKYKQFPQFVMKMIALFNNEVIYPLRYAQWYNDNGNGYDFASNEDLADLDRIHPRWTFEKELEMWGINDIKPAKG
jgi:hypothetical protein